MTKTTNTLNKTFFMLVLPVLALSACGITPASRETPINWGKPDPVHGAVLASPSDPLAIGCQDYDNRRTEWDRAVSYDPKIYSPENANTFCRSREQMALERGGDTFLANRPNRHDTTLRDRNNAAPTEFIPIKAR